MYLEVNSQYLDILQDMQQVIHNVYDILGFLLLCFVVFLVYKLFNSFF